MKKKVALIFGTRPEAIKLVPVIHALKQQSELDFDICVTGQHKEMLEQILDVFDVHPNANLSVMQENQTLAGLTSRLLTGIDRYLTDAKPDLVLAEGDTTTVFVTALVCFYKKIPFGHVEAGLRTYNVQAPWPEEANRVLTAPLSALHFAPTESARDNLHKEHIDPARIHVVGNTVIDALRYVISQLDLHKTVLEHDLPHDLLKTKNEVVLITGHRRENFDGGLERVCRAIGTLAQRFPDVLFVYPVHLNPAVQRAVQNMLTNRYSNVILLSPLSYIPFVWLMQRARFIITDSGGIQEEAPGLGKPVLVTREVTERPEGIETGNALLVGTDEQKLIDTASRLLTDEQFYASMAQARNPYGDGTAGEKIVALCKEFLYGEK